MTDVTDPLADALARQPEAPPKFRKGVVKSWSQATGDNVITVGGVDLTNVPFLQEALVAYLPGDVVLLMLQGASWAILGRVTAPDSGPAGAIGRFTDQTNATANGSQASGWSTSTSAVTKDSVSLPLPSWATIVTLTSSFHLRAVNSTGVDDLLLGRILVTSSGAEIDPADNFTWASASVPAGKLGSLTVVHHCIVINPAGIPSITVDGQVFTNAAGWAASANNACQVQVTYTYNRGGFS